MKGFLFDENLPARLRFSPKLPIVSTSKVGRNPSDSQIWEFARKHDLVIVSKDADFSDRIITQIAAATGGAFAIRQSPQK